jgi:Flp pilus assembly protein TadG
METPRTLFQPPNRQSSSRWRRSRGSEIIEFSFILLPLLLIIAVLLDSAWAIFAKSTFQYAVRTAVRRGITLTATSPQITGGGGTCLTAAVQSIVQQSAMGLLHGNNNLQYIKVRYYLPPPPNSNAALTDVTAQANGNSPGNIMEVAVEGYPLVPLLPRIFLGPGQPDKNPLTFQSVNAADLIEPSRNPPCK